VPLVLGIVRIVGIVGLVLLVVCAPAIVVGAVKLARRRRRRRRPDAVSRIAGGWQELVDAGRDYGYDVPPASTRLEAARAVGIAGLDTLARRADTAVFADDRTDFTEADRYWSDVAAVRALWAREFSRWQRIRAAVRTRSLASNRRPSDGGGARRG